MQLRPNASNSHCEIRLQVPYWRVTTGDCYVDKTVITSKLQLFQLPYLDEECYTTAGIGSSEACERRRYPTLLPALTSRSPFGYKRSHPYNAIIETAS
ncbi:hypothetical protein J6590_036945 [Homalodisca vitripennis]|nr:hypothetical protein J6590_036945 [Homalodisca vitripennis]